MGKKFLWEAASANDLPLPGQWTEYEATPESRAIVGDSSDLAEGQYGIYRTYVALIAPKSFWLGKSVDFSSTALVGGYSEGWYYLRFGLRAVGNPAIGHKIEIVNSATGNFRTDASLYIRSNNGGRISSSRFISWAPYIQQDITAYDTDCLDDLFDYELFCDHAIQRGTGARSAVILPPVFNISEITITPVTE